ncbi:MAG TPA: mechanosensitive ion channel domain-containing protein [Verrucomicrobiae bacterium]|nr:mechanosensitive ion channel domain-containing protein [Verrucomicrobiae bacterium]
MKTITGINLLNDFTVGLTTLFSDALKQIFGAGIEQSLIGSITRLDVAVTFCFVLIVLLAHALAAILVRLKAKKLEATDAKDWKKQLVYAIGKPLYLLIWIYGAYLIATPLLLELAAAEKLVVFREILNRFFDLGVFAALFWLFFRFTRVLEIFIIAAAAKTSSKWDDLFAPLLGKSLRIFLPVLGIIFALPVLNLPAEYAGVLGKGSSILLIVAVTLIAFQAVKLVEKAVLTRFDITVADNLQARKVYTQVHVISKTLYVIIGLFAAASILMLFEEVRQFGTSILASAGVVGIIIGFAAQKTISNLFAGFQLAMTQPIRLDDVVIVEGEWGRIEEITLTYIVIRIWDDRRLVVPLSYFIEKPFQNWTRTSANLLGSVFVWVDYSLPLDETRKALKEIIEASRLWDKRFWNLQVSDATERTMQIRVLATAANSSQAWDLRCEIREKLIAYIQKNHPRSLPQLRARFDDGTPANPLLKS